MKYITVHLVISFLCLGTGAILYHQISEAAVKEDYVLPGNVKRGWEVFTAKKCGLCHSIWGEGGKGGPDLGILPESYVSPSQLAALMWSHGPEMWGKMRTRRIPSLKIDKREMADLFAFLYFIRYMDEPGDAKKGQMLMESKGCVKCHAVKKGEKEDLIRWGMYVNPILWAEIMWNHAPQMGKEIERSGISGVEFKGREMVDLIAYIRSLRGNIEKVYLSPGDPTSGEKIFTQKGCIQCHAPGGKMDLGRRKDFPRTLAQLAGTMWNHSNKMGKEMEAKGIIYPSFSSQEMADLIAYLFSSRYFDEPGSPAQGKTVFAVKQCILCHAKGAKGPTLSNLKGQISPIFMAQVMWNHGPAMLETMSKAKVPWQKINEKEMVDLMEYLNQGMP